MFNAKKADSAVMEATYVAPFENLRMTDVESVGGKNASLGEMISHLADAGVRVPGGFASTAKAFRDFLDYSADGGATLARRIAARLESLDVDNVRALAEAGADIRNWIVETPFQPRRQQETFLNVVGIDNVLEAIKHVLTTQNNDRAISYRVHKGFTHGEVALSA